MIRSVVPLALALLLPMRGGAQGKSQEIQVAAVPTEAKARADKASGKARWSSAFRHTKESGETREWYRLVGTRSQAKGRAQVKSCGDVEEPEIEVRAIQIRVLPGGDIVDIWTQAF